MKTGVTGTEEGDNLSSSQSVAEDAVVSKAGSFKAETLHAVDEAYVLVEVRSLCVTAQ